MKQNNFFGAAPAMPCQKSSRIMGLGIHAEGRAQIPLSSLATIGRLARAQDRNGLH